MTILKPFRLRTGDILDVIAPSLPVLPSDAEAYQQGKRVLEHSGAFG